MLTSHISGRTSRACPLSRVMLAGASICFSPPTASGAAMLAAKRDSRRRASRMGCENHGSDTQFGGF